MHRLALFASFCAFLLVFSRCSKEQGNTPQTDSFLFEVPSHFPEPQYQFTNNPLTLAGFELGKKLFYEPALSIDSSISCGSCHFQESGFADAGKPLSFGVENRLGTRNSPSLSNLAWNTSFMWDGGINHLEIMPFAPIDAEFEMDSDLQLIASRLNKNENYKKLMYAAFKTDSATSTVIFKALAQFMGTMVSANAKYDRFLLNKALFTTEEQLGYSLFQRKCATCHQEPLTTNFEFENNGTFYRNSSDSGRYRITLNPKDIGKFKVPSLRNVALSAPYMHNGEYATLEEVIDHYTELDQNDNLRSEKLPNALNVSTIEKRAIIAFLNTLTDSTYLHNPKYAPVF